MLIFATDRDVSQSPLPLAQHCTLLTHVRRARHNFKNKMLHISNDMQSCHPMHRVFVANCCIRISIVAVSAGKSVVCTVWFHRACNLPTMAKRLGIVYCLNRPCALYSIKIPFTCKNNTPADSTPQAACLTEGLLSAMSPKFSPRGDKLIFLSHDAAASSGVHSATAALKSIQWTPGILSSQITTAGALLYVILLLTLLRCEEQQVQSQSVACCEAYWH